MKHATVTVEVSGNVFGEDSLRKLVYTEDVHNDIDVARTLIRAARLIHPAAVTELRDEINKG